MKATSSLLSGLTGAVLLTASHQLARRLTPKAPRMDVLGMRALKRGYRAAGGRVPSRRRLSRQALIGDLIANTAFFANVSTGRRPATWRRGLTLGLGAGVGALALSRPLGLGDPPHSESRTNQALTIGLYLLAGLGAVMASQWLHRDR